MKSKKNIIFLLLILIIGGAGFYIFKYNPSVVSAITGKKEVHFYIPEFSDVPTDQQQAQNREVPTEQEIQEIINHLKPAEYAASLHLYSDSFLDSAESLKSNKDKIIVGLTNYVMFDKTNKEVLPLEILLAVSPDLKNKCEIDVGLVAPKKLNYTSLKDLNDKAIATVVESTPLSIFLFPKLEEQNVIFQKTSLNIILPWLMSQIEEGNIHGFITTFFNFGDHMFAKFFGKSNGKEFKLFPQFKVIDSSPTGIPCFVLVINKNASEDDKEKIRTTFINKFSSQDFSQNVKSKIKMLGSVYPVKIEPKTLETLEIYRKKRFRSISKLVLENEI